MRPRFLKILFLSNTHTGAPITFWSMLSLRKQGGACGQTFVDSILLFRYLLQIEDMAGLAKKSQLRRQNGNFLIFSPRLLATCSKIKTPPSVLWIMWLWKRLCLTFITCLPDGGFIHKQNFQLECEQSTCPCPNRSNRVVRCNHLVDQKRKQQQQFWVYLMELASATV